MRVLVLTVEGLQPAYLGPYGNEWVPTPTLDHWAASGVVFDWHFADSPDLDSARRSWRSGRHPFAAGPSGADLIADLRAAGVPTARVGPALPQDHPFTSGWGLHVSAERNPDDPLSLKPTRRALRQAIEKLGDAEHALLWVEIDALLPPWQPADEYLSELFAETDEEEGIEGEETNAMETEAEEADEMLPWLGPLPDSISGDDELSFSRLQRTYGAAVATLDKSLGRLLDDCAKREWGETALWVLTSGRGFALGEHRSVGFSGLQLHEETVHLPLLFRWPALRHAGLRVNTLTQSGDLAPTLRDVFGMTSSASGDVLSGASLVRQATGEDGQSREIAVCGMRSDGRVIWSVRSHKWYLILDDSSRDDDWQLFVKPDDRWEVNDVRQHNLEAADELAQTLRAIRGQCP